jgi:acylglycerol lipase
LLTFKIAATIEWIQTNARDMKVPVFVAYGSSDSVVPPSGTQQLYNKLGSSDKTLEIYDGYYHRLFDDVDREKVLEDVTSWLDAHV